MNDNMQIATTIKQQIGGRKFEVMTGAHSFAAGDKELSFKLPRKSGYVRNGICYVSIKLDPSDTYTMRFGKFTGSLSKGNLAFKIVEEHPDLYFDNLQDVFTRVTGLDTHL